MQSVKSFLAIKGAEFKVQIVKWRGKNLFCAKYKIILRNYKDISLLLQVQSAKCKAERPFGAKSIFTKVQSVDSKVERGSHAVQ